MQVLRDFFGFFSNVRRIREALERISERIAPRKDDPRRSWWV